MVAITTSTLVAAAVNTAIAVTANLAISEIFKPKGADSQPLEIERRLATNVPREVLVGRSMVSGTTLFEDSFDGPENNRRGMYVVPVVFSAFEITAFHRLLIDNEEVTLSGNPLTGEREVTSHYLGKDGGAGIGRVRAWFRLYSGTEAQDACQELRQWFPSKFDAASRYSGMCVGILRCRRDVKADEEEMPWRGGFPSFRAELSGAPILNVRTGVTEYSNNPADVWYANQLGFLRGGQPIAGCGVPETALDLEAAQIAAQYFEDRGWTCNGMLTSGNQLADNRAILDCCNAVIDESGGKIRIFARRARSVSATLDISQFETAYVSSYDPQGLSTSRYNAAVTYYNEPSTNYLPADTEQINNTTFLAEDNGDFRLLSQTLELCTSRAQAEEIQSQDLLDGRNTRTLTLSGLPAWYYFADDFDLNKVITVNGTDYDDINGVDYEITSKTLSGSIVSLTLLEYTSEAYIPPPVISPTPPAIPLLPYDPIPWPYVPSDTLNSLVNRINQVDIAAGGGSSVTGDPPLEAF